MPRGNDSVSIMSIPAVAACKSLSRDASGKSGRQIWPTTISASANAGIIRCMSLRSARITGSSSLSRILAMMRGATRAAKPPRNRVFMGRASIRGHEIDQAVAAREAAKVFGDLVPPTAPHAAGPARIVRRDDDVRQLVKRMGRAAAGWLGFGRILPPDIDRRAAEPAVAQCFIQRILVDNGAAGDVDQERIGLHQREAARVDQPGGLRPERGAQSDRVAFRQHLVEIGERVDAFDDGIGLTLRAVGGEDARPERRRALCQLASDAAIADDAERRIAHLAVRRAALDPAGTPRAALAELAGYLK